MPFNGSGTYAAPALPGSWNPATTGSSATPADWNTLLADLSTALSTTITKDGQTTITANIPMATHKITGLGNATALTDALNQQGALYLVSTQTVTTLTDIDFTLIPATVTNLMVVGDLITSASNVVLSMQTYGADGVLDTGASDYYFAATNTTTGSLQGVTTATGSSIALASGVLLGPSGIGFSFTTGNIQGASFTKFDYRANWFDQGTVVANGWWGYGARTEADRITGIRISISSGTVTGKVSLFASV